MQEINNDIQNSSANPVSKLKPINDVISLINNASEKNKRKPDTFKVFLKKLSDHQDTDPSLAELCKKSIALNNEKEKLKAINLCIEKINVQTNSSKTEKSTVNSKTDIPETEFNIEHLVTLLDWITIPGKSQIKLDTLKQQLEQRKDGANTGNLLRRIALTISNAYMEIQAELNETENFLKKSPNN